jgi:hypothetical protein
LDAAEGEGTSISDTSELLDGWKLDPARFAAIIQVPWVDTALQGIDWGFFCARYDKVCDEQKGCYMNRLYTNERFEEHLRLYKEIQDDGH